MRRIVMVLLVVMWLLNLATPARAERNWEFSIGGFGGWAFHADTTLRHNWEVTPFGLEPVNARGTGLRFEDSATFGGKLTTWYVPKKYNWQPQIGLELEGTRFTADVPPQTIGGSGYGVISGLPIGVVTVPSRREFGVDNLAVNLLFRYPIWATPDMPSGRWYPYVGIGGGMQRARLTESSSANQETSHGPLFQALAGVKLFLFKHLAVFAEGKWTQGWHHFTYSGVAGVPPGYREGFAIATVHAVGGVALHF